MADISSEFPPRLHALMAPEARRGVVIRRGPSGVVGTFGWDLDTDRIEPGQWLKGRLYERRADLSPDGRHLIYFAMNGRWHDPVSKGSWTAISRAPFLKAVAFWPWGDCWVGGGLFLDARRFWLNGGGVPAWGPPQELRQVEGGRPEGWGNAECLGVYYPRLLRDGWTRDRGWPTRPEGEVDARFEKALAHGWTLVKDAHASADHPVGTGCYWDTHMLRAPDGSVEPRPGWGWAERDGRDVVYAEEGRLWRQRVRSADALGEPCLVHDFAAYTFAPVEAPY